MNPTQLAIASKLIDNEFDVSETMPSRDDMEIVTPVEHATCHCCGDIYLLEPDTNQRSFFCPICEEL